jgi:hypothetical protein
VKQSLTSQLVVDLRRRQLELVAATAGTQAMPAVLPPARSS